MRLEVINTRSPNRDETILGSWLTLDVPWSRRQPSVEILISKAKIYVWEYSSVKGIKTGEVLKAISSFYICSNKSMNVGMPPWLRRHDLPSRPTPPTHPHRKPSRLFRFPGAEIPTFYISLAPREWSFHIVHTQKMWLMEHAGQQNTPWRKCQQFPYAYGQFQPRFLSGEVERWPTVATPSVNVSVNSRWPGSVTILVRYHLMDGILGKGAKNSDKVKLTPLGYWSAVVKRRTRNQRWCPGLFYGLYNSLHRGGKFGEDDGFRCK